MHFIISFNGSKGQSAICWGEVHHPCAPLLLQVSWICEIPGQGGVVLTEDNILLVMRKTITTTSKLALFTL